MPSEVPTGWALRRLGNLGSTYSGLSGKTKADFGSGRPFVTYRQVFNGGAIDVMACDKVEVAEGERQNVVRPGDVLFTTSSETPKEVAYSAVVQGDVPEMYLNSFCFGFRPAPTAGLSNSFSKFFFRGPDFRAAAVRLGQGSTRYNISKTKLMEVSLPLPPLPEQKKIAAILSSVDEAIQATQAVIEQARRVKEGLLQDLLTRGIGHTRFKQTKIGEIPESWEVRRLDGILSDGPRNGMYKPADQIGSGSLIVGQTAFTHDRMVDFGATRRAEATEDEVATYGLQRGDILVTRVYATPEGCGRPAFVGSVPETAVYESNMMRLRPDPDMVEPYFVFSWLQKPLLRRYLMARASSSNQTSINQKTLGAVPIGVPSRLEQTRIVEAIRAAEITVWETEEELRATQSVKAGLLQDLLTGKVRVSV